MVPLEFDDRGDPKLDLQCSVKDDPHARAEASALAGRLHRALKQLPENQRSALLLKRFQDMSYRQIAEILDVTPSAVDSLLVRARRNLSANLAQDYQLNGVESK
jgi:RNA polymerase sigma-70 factor (ECF subfamily)